MKIRSRFLTRIAAWVAVVALRALFLTCRKVVRTETVGTSPYGECDEQFLYSVWHDQLLFALLCGKQRKVAGLVSRHQDGSYLSDAMKIIGVTPIRGSTSRGGALALRQMMEAAHDHHIVITPDGPRGPRQEMKSGIVYLASRSGRKIIPVAHACNRCWRVQGSWTDMMIPKPFSRVYGLAGRPIKVPSELDREGIARFTREVQTEMQRLERVLTDTIAGNSQPESELSTAA